MGLSCGVEDRLRGPFAVRGSTVVGGFIVNCVGRPVLDGCSRCGDVVESG